MNFFHLYPITDRPELEIFIMVSNILGISLSCYLSAEQKLKLRVEEKQECNNCMLFYNSNCIVNKIQFDSNTQTMKQHQQKILVQKATHDVSYPPSATESQEVTLTLLSQLYRLSGLFQTRAQYSTCLIYKCISTQYIIYV